MEWVRLHFGEKHCKEVALCPDEATHGEHSWAYVKDPNSFYWCYGWEV